jgi:6-phosphogluconate dehydrogenase
MVGGHDHAFKAIEPVLQTLAAPSGAYNYFGLSGAGHYLKMIHSAVQTGMLQALAEGYNALSSGPFTSLDLGAVGEVWQRGSEVSSWLNYLIAQALKASPELNNANGLAAVPAQVRLALDLAKEADQTLPATQAAADVRLATQNGQINLATKIISVLEQPPPA